MKTNCHNQDYLTPEVIVVEQTVEVGFAQTNLEDPVENDVLDW